MYNKYEVQKVELLSSCLSCEAAQICSLISSSLSVATGKVRLDPSWFGSGCDLPQTGQLTNSFLFQTLSISVLCFILSDTDVNTDVIIDMSMISD